jgi:multimeric flavodoxin WrbA
MKVLLINGSANKNGCTFTALNEVATTLEKENIETEILQLGNVALRDCCGCMGCKNKTIGKCVFTDDIVNEIIEKAKTFDGFIFGSPVYYAHPSGRILSLLDRAFFAGSSAFAYKPAGAVVSARRAGTTASFDVLNKYFSINNMPIVSSQYWNNVHGSASEDVQKDLEGLQTMRVLGRNMAWLLKCIELGKQNGLLRPEDEVRMRTNFIKQ